MFATYPPLQAPTPSTLPPASSSSSAIPSNPPSNPQSPADRKPTAPPTGLNARSCVTCRRRKVKCDKKEPCSNCTKAQTQCVFPAPGRAPRRPRQGGKPLSEREAELLKRLRRLEGVVEELSGQVELEAVKHSPASDQSRDGEAGEAGGEKSASVRVIGMDEGNGTKKDWIVRGFALGSGPPKAQFAVHHAEGTAGRLVLEEGKSQYVSSPFWATISDEVEELREIIEEQHLESDEELPILPTDTITEPNHQSFIMGYNSSDVDLKSLHPLPSQIPFYWQTFLENVHPLVKILHAQTMNKVIKEVQNNLSSLSESTEALMFAIYFATITSMNSSEVKKSFGVEKDYLVKQYRFGVEQALAKAGFLNTNEIVTVQAFVLFLVCVRRHDDTRFVWSLTGLAIRIAQSLGLHRDGTVFGLSPFDTEMRRRLWWQICVLDVRAAEDHGSDPSIMDQSFDTELPLSINDIDLDPDATEPPVPRPGVSEMTFCLIRYEIGHLSRKLSYIPPGQGPGRDKALSLTLEDKERIIKETADHLEEKYLQYCENAGPLYWVAATVARLIIAKMTLIIYHPLTQPRNSNNPLPQNIRDRLFMASIEIIEYSQVLEAETSTKKWGWLFHTYIQWHAIAYVLGDLYNRPPSLIVERAWKAVDSVFREWGGQIRSTKTGMIWQPMRKLLARARRKREEDMRDHHPASLELGIDSRYVRPPPQCMSDTLSRPEACPASTPRETLFTQTSDTTMDFVSNLVSPSPSTQNPNFPHHHTAPSHQYPYDMSMPSAPQTLGIPPAQPEQQQPWVMDENALLDLDMNESGDVNWESWDDLVRNFEMGNEGERGIDGNLKGGMGGWW